MLSNVVPGKQSQGLYSPGLIRCGLPAVGGLVAGTAVVSQAPQPHRHPPALLGPPATYPITRENLNDLNCSETYTSWVDICAVTTPKACPRAPRSFCSSPAACLEEGPWLRGSPGPGAGASGPEWRASFRFRGCRRAPDHRWVPGAWGRGPGARVEGILPFQGLPPSA